MSWGLSGSKWSPIPSVGGGGSNVTAVSQALTPSAGTVSVVADKLSGGMLDGWSIRNLGGVIDAMSDDGSAFTLMIQQSSVDAAGSWCINNSSIDAQGFVFWPELLMGDFEIEVKFTAPVHASSNTGIALVAAQILSDPLWNHHCGVRISHWNAPTGKPLVGAVGQGTRTTQQGLLTWSDDNWIKLSRVGQLVTGSYCKDGDAYTSLLSDSWGVDGGNVYVGIGFHSNSAGGPATEEMDLLAVNLTGSEYTATP